MNAKLSKGNGVRTAKRVLGLAGLASLMLFCAGPSRAQSSAPTASAPARQAAAAAISPVQAKEVAAQPGEAGAKGEDTGIKVHGHWVINVLTPDGQLVSHTEFDNSLQSTGMTVLATTLAGYNTIGRWELSFAGTLGPCTTLYSSTTISGTCIIRQGPAAVTSCGTSGCVSNIMGSPRALPGATTMQLVGALTFPSAGNVTQVETIVGSCGEGSSPTACATLTSQPTSAIFTSASLPAPVSVAANQLVQITVTFSFS